MRTQDGPHRFRCGPHDFPKIDKEMVKTGFFDYLDFALLFAPAGPDEKEIREKSGGDWWRGLAQIGREGLNLVARLNLLDVRHVFGVEKLGPVARQRELG